MTVYLSNRDGNGKTSEEGHYKFQTAVFSGNVLGATALQVKQNSPLGRSVLVSAGQYKIDTSNGYSYTGWNTADEVVAISTADPANPRITTIVVYVDKNASTSASPPNNPGITKFMAVNGTPAASPSAPNSTVIQAAVGAGNPYVILANVTVPTAASQIVTANISDQRSQVTVGVGLVGTTSLQDNAVTTAKIPDLAISTAKIADSAVSTAKLANNSVTAAKIEAQQGWVTPALGSSWVNYANGWSTVGYMKDSLGFVQFKGLMQNGQSGGATVFTLPVGYRPLATIMFIVPAASGAARIDVNTNGTVFVNTYHAGGNNGYVSLNNVSFKAEQ